MSERPSPKRMNQAFSEKNIKQFRVLVFYVVTATFFVVDLIHTFATQTAAPGITTARVAGITALVIFGVAPLIYNLTGRLREVSAAILVTAFAATLFSSLNQGGAPAPTMAFFIFMPLASTILLGRVAGVIALGFSATAIGYCGYASLNGFAPTSPHSATELSVLFTSAALLCSIAVATVALSYEALVLRTITDLKAANNDLKVKSSELADREEFLSAVMETVHDGIAAADKTGRLTVLNRAARQNYGKDFEPADVSEWQKMFSVYETDGKTPLPDSDMPLLRALKGEKIIDKELMISQPNKPARRICVSASPVLNAQKEIIGAVATSKDVTIERQQQDEIRQRNLELDQFARVAAHDLQSPLRGIIGLTNELNSDLDGAAPTAKEALGKIGRSAEKMSELIKDVLHMSRLSAGQLTLQPVSPRDCIEAALDFIGTAESSGEVEIGFNEMTDVLADPRGLIQVYQNLITNAIKFQREGFTPQLEFTCEREGELVCLGVKDNGIGISEEDSERIFLPTERLKTELDYEGTGLGLAICRNTLSKMQGEIWVESTPGRGAHFKFRLAASNTVHDAA